MIARTPIGATKVAPLAVMVGRYPLTSETFVRREIAMLRQRGVRVHVMGLRGSDERVLSADGEPELPDAIVYDWPHRMAARLLGELVRHPLTTAGTLMRGTGDARRSSDLNGAGARLKAIVQVLAGIAAARWLRAVSVEHVHCHFAHAPTSVGMYAAMQLGIGFSFTGHANDLFQRRTLLVPKLRRARFVACISQWHRQFYRALCPEQAQRYRIVRCGVDARRWNARPDAAVWSGPVRLLSVGRLVSKKGFDTLIRALAELEQQRSGQWRLSIVGDGPQRQALERLAERLGVAERVTFHGAMDHDALPGMVADHDGFVLCCRADAAEDRDGIPVVLMEAMAAGLPVVAGDLPAIRELVIEQRTGLLVDGREPAAVAEALQRLAEDPSLRRTLVKNARQWVGQEFSAQRNLDRLIEALAEQGSPDEAMEAHRAAAPTLHPPSPTAKPPA